MNAAELVQFLGKASRSPEVSQLLSSLGVTKPPKVKKGDSDAIVDTKKGAILVFEQPEVGGKELTLADLQFYAGLPMQDSKRFSGVLPEDLVFEDSQAAVRGKLGAPDDDLDGIDVWKREGYELTIEYRRDRSSIALLHLGTST